MANKKPMVMSEVVPVMSKIMNHKLNCLNYLDKRKPISLYLRGIDMDKHLIEDPSIDDSKQ